MFLVGKLLPYLNRLCNVHTVWAAYIVVFIAYGMGMLLITVPCIGIPVEQLKMR